MLNSHCLKQHCCFGLLVGASNFQKLKEEVIKVQTNKCSYFTEQTHVLQVNHVSKHQAHTNEKDQSLPLSSTQDTEEDRHTKSCFVLE